MASSMFAAFVVAADSLTCLDRAAALLSGFDSVANGLAGFVQTWCRGGDAMAADEMESVDEVLLWFW